MMMLEIRMHKSKSCILLLSKRKQYYIFNNTGFEYVKIQIIERNLNNYQFKYKISIIEKCDLQNF